MLGAPVRRARRQSVAPDLGANVVDVSRSLVAEGLAWAHDGYAKDANLYDLQAAAKEARRGLWSASSPVPAWDWRKGVR